VSEARQAEPMSTPNRKLQPVAPLHSSADLSTLAGRPWNRIVSVISPCRNEAAHIGPFLESVLAQRLPAGVTLEVLIADGQSDDGTRESLDRYANAYPGIEVLDNPRRIVSTGLNAAIRRARGDVILRMDAHTIYAPDYIKECLRCLDKTGADNVGGPWVAKGSGYISEAIARAFSSPLVSGGGKAHRAAYEGPVDTVYLGCWPRQTFEKIGLFDEDFVRTQDSELNLRILRGGGKIWQTPAIRSWYIPRPSLTQLARQYTQYGYWKARVIKKHKLPASVRQLVPGGFLAALLVLAVLTPFVSWAGIAFASLVLAYAAAVGVGSLLTCAAPGQWKLLPIMPLVFAVYQLSYGYGFWRGVIDFIVRQREGDKRLSALTRVSAAPPRRPPQSNQEAVGGRAARESGVV
jgi:succinoglycan biosynthesis protein ExoA